MPFALSHERMLDRDDRRDEPGPWSGRSSRGMVATAHYLATEAGARTLDRGGNAFDAAVAASFALGVCERAASGLGGMAMVLAHDAVHGRTFVVEGACRAPRTATPERVAGRPRYRGYRAIAVPTNVAVLRHLLSRYGRLPLADVLDPAIAIAEAGVPLTSVQRQVIVDNLRAVRRGNISGLFLDADLHPPPPGTITRQPVLANTLRRLAIHGLDDFYRGGIAREIVADMQANGGFVSEIDLASSRLCREASPLTIPFGRGHVASVPPPGGGMTLLQMINLAAHLHASIDPDTAEGAVLVAAIIQQARSDRRACRLRMGARGLGRAEHLLTDAHAATTARALAAALGSPGPDVAALSPRRDASGETTHLSVMDAEGNVVALTQSIERTFGSAIATPRLGFLYNGYLRAFKVRTPSHPHYLRPGAPARSNAAPTIAFRDGRPWAALGSTGSERMASGIFQVLLRLTRQDPFAAVHAPRLHCTPEGLVMLEADRFSDATLEALVRQGFVLEHLDPYSFKMGGLQLVVTDGRTFHGVGEPRRDGAASGPA